MTGDYTDLIGQLAKWRPNDTEFVMLTEADWAKVVAMALGPDAKPHDTIGVEVMLVMLEQPEPEYRCDNCDEWVTTYPRADSYVGDAWNAASPEGARCCDQCGMPVQEGNLRVA